MYRKLSIITTVVMLSDDFMQTKVSQLIPVPWFITSYYTKVLLILFILFICILITARFKPFVQEDHNRLEQISISVSLVTCYCGLFYVSALADDERMQLLFVIVASNASFVLAVVKYAIREHRRKKSEAMLGELPAQFEPLLKPL